MRDSCEKQFEMSTKLKKTVHFHRNLFLYRKNFAGVSIISSGLLDYAIQSQV